MNKFSFSLIILVITLFLISVACVSETDLCLAKCKKMRNNDKYKATLINPKNKIKVKTDDLITCQKLCYKGYK